MVAARSSALACLIVVAALQSQAGAQPPVATLRLYLCRGAGHCVPTAPNDPAGLPLSECEEVCVAPPSANYTCQSGQCVISGRGLPKAECTQVCGGPGPPTTQFICQVGFCVECTGDECVSKSDCEQACGSTSIIARAKASPDLSTLVTALEASSANETDGGSDDLVDLLAGGLGNEGPFTVFAPTNEAFSQLSPGVLASLLKPENKAALNNVCLLSN
jgi:hypothetical protein